MSKTQSESQSTCVRLGQAFVQTHFPVNVISGVAAISLSLIRRNFIETWILVGYSLFIILCFHQLEEYRFPGGFVWGLNMALGSKTPDNYPGNSLSATFVDVVSLIVWGVWLFVWPSKQLVAFLILFAILEVLGHLNFGWVALRRYSVVGKRTVYFPGNLTAFLGFAPFAIWGLHEFIDGNLLTGHEWMTVILITLIFMVAIGAITLFASQHDSPFTYPAISAEGFYLHRYEQLLRDRKA